MALRFFKRSISMVAALTVSLMVSQPSQAQQPAAKPRPASQEDMSTYFSMAGFSMCSLAQSKVSYKSSIQANVEMIGATLILKHGRRVVGIDSELNDQQISNIAFGNILISVDRVCSKNLPADWKKEFDPALTQIKTQLQKPKQK